MNSIIERQRAALNRWRAENNNLGYRLNYDLNENSVVFDAGGYEGWFAEQIYNKYKYNVYVFEPVYQFYKSIEEKFKDNSKVKVYNLGVSTETKNVQFFLHNDGTSSHRNFNNQTNFINANVIDIKSFINDNDIKNISLFKINIEGEEYPLLEYMIEKNLIKDIDHLQIQFHDFVDNAENRRNIIRDHLSNTHTCMYNFEFVWESWSKK